MVFLSNVTLTGSVCVGGVLFFCSLGFLRLADLQNQASVSQVTQSSKQRCWDASTDKTVQAPDDCFHCQQSVGPSMQSPSGQKFHLNQTTQKK